MVISAIKKNKAEFLKRERERERERERGERLRYLGCCVRQGSHF